MLQKILVTLVPLLALTGCLQAAEDPREVASQYWQALKNGDTETARSLVSNNSRQAFDSYVAAPADTKTDIGEINLGTEETTVITIVYPEGGAPDDFDTFDTVMVIEDGKWKVDAERTIIPRPAPSDRELEELKDQLSESMEENLESVEEAMNEGLMLLDEALREGSKDMGESMLKGMEEMNRALRESIEEMQKHRQEQQPSDPEGEGLI
jgi:hypothetical protein